AEDGIRDRNVTGVQTCALPISSYSMLEQRADSIALQVDDQESRIRNFTVDLEGITGTVADIEGDMVKQSSLEITPDYAQIGSMRSEERRVGKECRSRVAREPQ